MNIAVFGLGYVGAVTAACLARDGHRVIGVDVAQAKVDIINSGHSPIVEEGMEEIVGAVVAAGRLQATTRVFDAIRDADIAIVCVGTPSRTNGSLDTSYVDKVSREIGGALRERDPHRPFLFVLRSTVLPGTVRDLVLPALADATGLPAGAGYEVVFHPEFLREGSAVHDFDDPPKIVIGERVPGCGKPLESIYCDFDAPLFKVSLGVAEAVKYADNVFHALKITYANEIAHFCGSRGVSAQEVMDIFCADTKLNLSRYYLRPGFAFGGSCLPKDLRAFLHAARQSDLRLPMLQGILPSNRARVERAAEQLLVTGARIVGLYGIAFKPGTDDLRESPYVTLAELLLGKGIDIRIYDPPVQYARLTGRNKSYIDATIPHLAERLVDNVENLMDCVLVATCHPIEPKTAELLRQAGVKILDVNLDVPL